MDDNSLLSGGLGNKEEQKTLFDNEGKTNAPERIRTSDLRIRNPLLYPAELRALKI